MKNNLIKLFLLLSVFCLTACGSLSYGNRNIAKQSLVKKIKTGDSGADVENLLGSPSQIHNEGTNKIYEYQYHEVSRSPIYFIPLVSAFYVGFSQNPLSLNRKVRTTIDHKYLFIAFNKKGEVTESNLVEDSVLTKLPELSCSNSGGVNRCVGSNNKTFSY